MEPQNSLTKRCYKSICLWSLLLDIITIISFFASAVYSIHNEGWGQVGWVIPLLVKAYSMLFFIVVHGYLLFIKYLEHKKIKNDIPFAIVYKTELIFENLFKSDRAKKIVNGLSKFSYIINMLLSLTNLFWVFCPLAFIILHLIRHIVIKIKGSSINC